MTTFISYGGGVQSTALVVLAALGKLDDVAGEPVRDAVFCNVGDDSEHPDTIEYVRNITPWAAARGVTITTRQRMRRDGTTETLLDRLTREGSRSVDIPVRMANGAPGNRSCTVEFKLKVSSKWARENGATKEAPFKVCIGFSTDEIQRLNNKRSDPYTTAIHPLLDLRLSRGDCAQLIADAGLPVPPKSACWFCPFHRPQTWSEMRRDEPELFAKSVELERTLNDRREMLGKDHVYLTRFGKPLDVAIGEAQTPLGLEFGPDNESCDSGACWT